MQGQRLWMLIGAAIAVVVLAAGGWWWLGHGHKSTAAASKQPHLIGDLGETANVLANTLPDQDKLCAATLTRALDFGALPSGTTLASSDAKAGQPEGRYSCDAQGSDGKYTMVVDASCPGGAEKTCFALDTVTREDGTVVYKRRPWPYQD